MKLLTYATALGATVLLFSFTNKTDTGSTEKWKKHHIVANQGLIQAIAPGDYNQDGKMDVVSSFEGKVVLYKAPHWEAELIHTFNKKNSRAISCVSLDVDQDGDLDWIGGTPRDGVIWLENPDEAGQQWVAREVDARINGLHHLMTADVNNDGKLDLLANNFAEDGEHAFSAMWYEIPQQPTHAHRWTCHTFAQGDAAGGSHYFGFGDIDNDGWGEIALAAKGGPFENGNWFAYWSNPGKDKITKPWSKNVLLENEIGATNIRIRDVNGDGQQDFIMSNGHGVGVFWVEAPHWKKHMIDSEMECPHSLTARDYDGDGDIDIASCGFKSERVSVYYNDGKGNYSRHDLDLKQQSYDLRSVDMDGDGDLDLINAGRGTKNLVWYENLGKH